VEVNKYEVNKYLVFWFVDNRFSSHGKGDKLNDLDNVDLDDVNDNKLRQLLSKKG